MHYLHNQMPPLSCPEILIPSAVPRFLTSQRLLGTSSLPWVSAGPGGVTATFLPGTLPRKVAHTAEPHSATRGCVLLGLTPRKVRGWKVERAGGRRARSVKGPSPHFCHPGPGSCKDPEHVAAAAGASAWPGDSVRSGRTCRVPRSHHGEGAFGAESPHPQLWCQKRQNLPDFLSGLGEPFTLT